MMRDDEWRFAFGLMFVFFLLGVSVGLFIAGVTYVLSR